MIKIRTLHSYFLAMGIVFSATAHAGLLELDFGDDRYLGSVSNPTPASPAADLQRVTNLLTVGLGDTDTILGTGGGGANTADYMRSFVDVSSGVGGSCGQGGNGNEHFAIGCDYFIQKYSGTGNQGNAYVWYIGGLDAGVDDLETPAWDGEGFHANQWQAFGSAAGVPEPNALSLMILGLLGLGLARKKF